MPGLSNLCTFGSGADEQLGGRGQLTYKKINTRRVWGHAPPEKFSNLHVLRLNLELFGVI